jgi:hypothetical protein
MHRAYSIRLGIDNELVGRVDGGHVRVTLNDALAGRQFARHPMRTPPVPPA